jgi:hypothetical protein
MASACAELREEGAGPGRLPDSHTGHTGVYRVAKVDGRRETGISGMLFLREDRACILRLVLQADGDRRLVRLIRGIWWQVPAGVKVMTSDGFVSVWPARRHSVVMKFPVAAHRGDARGANGVDIKFVRLR